MWTAQISFDAPGLDCPARIAIAEALDADVDYNESTGRLTLTFTVNGTTLRQALDAALRDSGRAIDAAGPGRSSRNTASIRVLRTDQFVAEIEHPPAAQHVGVAEIAEMLGVSRQRANHLIAAGGEFPSPVSRLAAGPVFTRASIEAFKKRWTRKSGRPWHKATKAAGA